MYYSQFLYTSKMSSSKKKRIIRQLNQRKFHPSVYLIVLPENHSGNLEMYSSSLLLQKFYPEEKSLIVGLAVGYDEGLQLIVKIITEVYTRTKGFDVKNYLLTREGCR